jgi:D-serine deaminase-like pyridoxal phosphate-dependent protein
MGLLLRYVVGNHGNRWLILTVLWVLYGLPCPPGALPQLSELRQQTKIQLMVDHESQIDSIEQFEAKSAQPTAWEIFIKVDMGSHRAGVETTSPRLKALIKRAEKSVAVNIYGFYCHAGHSYGCRTVESAATILNQEVKAACEAASMREADTPVVLSVGATPTVHVISMLDKSNGAHHKIELHGGMSTPKSLKYPYHALGHES